MKPDTRILAAKSQPMPHSAPAGGEKRGPSRSLRITQMVLTVIVSGLLTYWLCDNFILSRLPAELIGRWQVKEGPLEATTMEFFRNGTMRSQFVMEGQVITAEMRAEADDDMLTTTAYIPGNQVPLTAWRRVLNIFFPDVMGQVTVQRIVRLTRTELELEDQDGKLISMRRMGK